MKIILRNLPKYSLNKLYAGGHWTARKKMKDNYKSLIRSQTKLLLTKDKSYNTIYTFYFKSHALDASNCAGMAKLIEDVLFENDGYKIVRSVILKSRKDTDKRVEIEIEEE